MSIFKAITRQKIELYLGMFSIFLIPIHKNMLIISLLIWLIATITNLIIDSYKKEKIQINKNALVPLLIMPVFYIIHITGLLYSSNIQYGLFDLEVKFSMFIIPIMIIIRNKIYSEKQKQIIISLVIGVLTSFIINLSRAYIAYSVDGESSHFYYSLLSSSIHPSYMAFYVGICLFGLLYYRNNLIIIKSRKQTIITIIISMLLLSYLFMLSSKAGIISFAITLSLYASIRLAQRMKPIVAVIVGVVVLTIPFIVITQIPAVKIRFNDLTNTLKNSNNATIDAESGSVARLAIAQSMYEMSIKNLPWGVGTGDIKDEITKYYLSKGSTVITSKYLNAHNQFAQTTIAIGIPGFVTLICFILFGLMNAYRNRNILFLSFILLMSIHMLFESMLEQQAGVIFITLFYTLFYLWKDPKLNI